VAAGNITRELLREEIKALLQEVGLQRTQVADTLQSTQPSSSPRFFTWGGKFHKVPREFDFPSIDPLGAWRLWWFGDARRDYPPFKGITSDDLDTPRKKATMSEWSIMMRHIVDGIEAKTGAPLQTKRDEVHAIDLFKVGYATLRLKPSKRKRRESQIKLTTVLRLVREASDTRFPVQATEASKSNTAIKYFCA
jgi:hypothetical protein